MVIRTKRFAFRILSDYYDRLEKSLRDGLGLTAYENGCVTILGVRHVGKTTLLRQLADINKVPSRYFDCSGVSEDFNFEEFYEDSIRQGIKRLFLDEICKIPDELVADFIETTKYYSSQILITMTGSVSGVVSKMSDRIGRCRTLLLPPITYTERLAWSYGYEEIDLTGVSLRELTSYDKLMAYLRQQNTLSESSCINYVGSVVEDTLSSCLNRTLLEGVVLPDRTRIMQILKYISLCQYSYRLPNGSFVNIPSMSRKMKEIIEDYKRLKVKYNASTSEIRAVCRLLMVSGLARGVSALSSEDLSNISKVELVPLRQVDDAVPALVFEYPWFASYAIAQDLSGEDFLLAEWLENAFLSRLTYLYRFADKFRSENNYEVDVVYGIETSFDRYRLGGMETKNRKSSNVDRNHIARYRGVMDYLDLKDLCISCSDEENVYKNGCQFYRGDLIMIALELEYFNQRILDLSDDINSIFCRETITELLRKYGLI